MKRNFKKFIAVIMAIILVCGQITDMFAYGFSTVSDYKEPEKVISNMQPVQPFSNLSGVNPGTLPGQASKLSSDTASNMKASAENKLPEINSESLQNVLNQAGAVIEEPLTTSGSVSNDVYSGSSVVTTAIPVYTGTSEPVQTPADELKNTPLPVETPVSGTTPTATEIVPTAPVSTPTPTDVTVNTPTPTAIQSTTLPSLDVKSDVTLSEDMVYGSVNISGGTLDLNGHSITVCGNLVQSGGTVFINGGKLTVTGDYTIRNESSYCYANLKMINEADYVVVEGNFTTKSYNSHSGLLTAGTMEVKGNFTQLRDKQYYSGNTNNFAASGTHKVVLSGKAIQDVSFENPGDSIFNILDLSQSQGARFKTTVAANTINAFHKIDSLTSDVSVSAAKISLANDMEIQKNLVLSNCNIDTAGKSLNVKGGFTLAGGTFNVNGSNLDVKGDMNITGGTLSLNGGQVKVSGKLNQSVGTVDLSGGKLSVAGDYTISNTSNYCYAYLKMVNDADYLLVEGNLTFSSYYSHSGLLTAGTMEVKGNFTQLRDKHYYSGDVNNFAASGTHKVIMSGSVIQEISFENPGNSTFNILDLSQSKGVSFKTTVAANSINAFHMVDSKESDISVANAKISLTSDMKIQKNLVLSNCKLDTAGKDIDMKGSFTLSGGTLDLNGSDLVVQGDMNFQGGTANLGGGHLAVMGSINQTGGTMDINEGVLTVSGDYAVRNESNYCYAYLKMVKDADRVSVGGSFTMQSYYSHSGLLTAGTLEIKRNFTQLRDKHYYSGDVNNFVASGTHKVIMSGGAIQNISFENSGNSMFNILDLSESTGVSFKTTVAANTIKAFHRIDSEESDISVANAKISLTNDLEVQKNIVLSNCVLEPSGKNINVKGSFTLSGGTLNLNGSTLSVEGNMNINSGTVALIGGNIKVSGNLNQLSGTVDISGGKLNVTGDYAISNASNYCYAYLKMANEKDYVSVGGNFTMQSYYSHAGLLTAGTIEVKGSFTQLRDKHYYSGDANNFVASGTHRVLLSGEALQNVSFENPGNSSFNILELTKYFAGGYTFNSTPVWKTLVEQVKDTVPPTAPQKPEMLSSTVTTVSIVWEGSKDNVGVKGYEIYRDGILVGTAGDLKYTDTKLKPATEYRYKLLAFDAEGNKSGFCNEMIAKTPADTEAPNTVKNLRIQSANGSSVSFLWDAAVDNVGVAGYEIYCDETRLGTTAYTNFTDTKSIPGLYSYTVKAFDAAGNYSSVSDSVYYDNMAPSVPENLNIKSVDLASVELEWTGSTDNVGVLEYEIYRNGDKTGTSTGTSYKDTDLIPGTKYDYYVKARDKAGNSSGASNSVSPVTGNDNEVPSKPEKLSAVSTSDTVMNLSWTASTDNVKVAGYKIYRDGVLTANVREGLSYKDTGLKSNTKYSYTITAYDLSNNHSTSSEPVSAVTATIISNNLTLEKDMSFGSIYLTVGTINLNGHILSVDGSVYQSGGTMNINGGRLVISGDYKIDNGNSYCYAYLIMVKESDYVQVGGNFLTKAYYSHNGYLMAGTLEVKGDFTQSTYGGNADNFKPTGAHRVVLSGEKLQTISFAYPSYSYFNTLEIKNASKEGVRYTNYNAVSLITNGNKVAISNVSQMTLKLNEDVVLYDSLNLTGSSIDLNGYKLTVNGNLIQSGGTMNINGGYLSVTGDYRIDNGNSYCYSYLNMTKESDYVFVGGNFYTRSYYSHEGYLKAGTMEIKGDFTESTYGGYAENFKATETHKVILSGDKLQNINFTYPGNSCFNTLELKNSSSEGVKFISSYNATAIISNNCKFSMTSIGPKSLALTEDLILSGDLYLTGSSIDLNGHKLTINGNFYQSGGTMNINGGSQAISGNVTQSGGTMDIGGGQLIVTGDYKIDNGKSYCYAYLNMTKENGYVYVGGNFYTRAYYSHSDILTAGTLEVKGDFTEAQYGGNADNFKATGTHRVVLSGEKLQNISFVYPSYSYFNILDIRNSSQEGVKFTSIYNAASLINNRNKVTITNVNSLALKLSEDLILDNDLYLTGSSIDLNGFKLTINGNLTQSGGTMLINGGRLLVKGDYRIDNGNNYCYAYLNMTKENDYVYVGGNFYTRAYNSHEGMLTAGTLEVKGDFTESQYGGYAENFRATGTHKVVLSGDKLQSISFVYPASSYFNILELKNSSTEGVKFTTNYNAVSLIDNDYKVVISNVNSVTLKLNEDLVLNNDLYLTGASINLNGYKLTVNGNLTQSGGTMNINGGQLIVTGDYRIDNGNSYCYAYLNMTKENDYVYVGGSFYTRAYYSHEGLLNAGTLEVKGDFTESQYGGYAENFKSTGTHKVVLSGEKLQNISFVYPANSYFNILGITKPIDSGYSFSTKNVWKQLVEVSPDKEAPTAPANLKVSDKSHYTITLSWEPSTDNIKVSGYRIYRDNTKVGDTTTNSFTDRGLRPDTKYIYEVKACDINNNESQSSNRVDTSTNADPEPPSIPCGLKTVSKTDRTITVSWDASTDNIGVKGYVVYRDRKIIVTTEGLTYKDSGLIAKTRYTYQIKAFDNMENYSDFSVPMSETTAEDVQKPTAPGKPAVAEATETSIKISWEKSQDDFAVKGYEVYRDDRIIGTTSDTFYKDLQLLPDTTYKYYVRAFDSTPNYSSVSEAVYAATEKDAVVPAVPGNLQLVTKNAASVTFSWTKSTDNVALKGYNIYRDGVLLGMTDKLSYTDTGLTKDKSYTYVVKAVDTSDNESQAAELKVVPGVPDAPSGFTAVPGIYSIDISWEPVKSEGFSYYKLYSGSESSKLTFWMDVKNGTKAAKTGLSCGTTVYFAVSAVDIWGNEGPKTETSAATIVDTVPPQIKLFQPENGARISNRYIALKVNGTDNGAINKFVFEFSADSGKTWTKIADVDAVFDKDLNEYKAQTLWNNDSTSGKYMFKVWAVDKEGYTSEPSVTGITLDYLPPSVPQGISAIAAAGRNIISWNAVSSEDISRYRIYRKTENGNFAKLDTVNSDSLTYTDNNAKAGETYIYAVSAIDDLSNESDLSESIMVTTVNYSPELSITPDKGGPEAELSFKGKGFKPSESVDLYIDGTYLISAKADENGDVLLSWKFVKNVIPGSHKFSLKGKTSLTQAEAGFTAEFNLPSVPENLTAAAGQMEIRLSWSAPLGSGIAYYRVYRKNGTEVPVVVFDKVKTTSITDIEVLKDAEYGYQVSTVDIYGNEGGLSTVVSAKVIPDTQIPVITDFTTSRSGSIIKLSAKTVDNIGVTCLKFLYKNDSGEWIDIAQSNVVPKRNTNVITSYEWETKDIPDGYYETKAVAYDAQGNTSLENTLYLRVRNNPPQAPSEVSAVPGEVKVEIEWTEVKDSELEGYRVLRSVGGVDYQLVCTTNLLSYTDTKVVAGAIYLYKVIAVDKYGHESMGTLSNAVTVSNDKTAPVISGFEPLEGTTFGSTAAITVRAEDNFMLSSITLQYSVDGGSSWIDAGRIYTGDNAVFKWNTASLKGEVKIRAIAKDAAGNVSDGLPVRTYNIDTEGPSRITGLSAVSSITAVTLRWNSVPDNDFSYFQVERKDTLDGNYYVAGTSSNTLGLNVSGLAPETTYWFKVVPYDLLGNRGRESDEIQVTTLKDTALPVVNSIQPHSGNYNRSIALCGTVSDNAGISGITFQYSSDRASWKDISTISIAESPKYASASCSFDVSSLPQGIYYVRIVAKDIYGNSSKTDATASYVEYSVDHTAPIKPSELTITSSTGSLTLQWTKGSEADISYYNVLRCDREDGQYTLLGRVSALWYRDRNVQTDKVYYYKVSAGDTAGNESVFSDTVSGTLKEDNEAPQIVSFNFPDNSTLPANPLIRVLASDNYMLKKVVLEYKAGNEDTNEWLMIGSCDLNTYSGVAAFNWNTSALREGKYTVRACAEDTKGLKSPYVSMNYSLNLNPPGKPQLAVKPGGWKIELSWQGVTDSDLTGYRVYRSTGSNSSYRRIKETDKTQFTDNSLTPGVTYYYKVEAVDIYGNSSYSDECNAVPTNEDLYAPSAEAGEDMTAALGRSVAFDGTKSTDNDRIARYQWYFGDGGQASGSNPIHTYTSSGDYTVTMAVYDPAGNEGVDTLKVSVVDLSESGTLKVKVVDDSTGAEVPGADLIAVTPDGKSIKLITDSNGAAIVTGKAGSCKIYAYKEEYKPKYMEATIVKGKEANVTVRIPRGQLVVGSLTVRRLQLDEIKQLGIDVTAPTNQFVYRYEIHLAFNNNPLPDQELIVNGNGQLMNDWKPVRIDDEYIAYPRVISHPDHPEVRPTVAYMVMPAQVSMLKEFFEVTLTLENTADPQFEITDSSATLKLPNGLELVPTDYSRSLNVDLGKIAGGENRTVKWVINSNKTGSYNLEAEFKGILQPFEKPVSTIFKTTEPFKVWGGSALQITLEVEEAAYSASAFKPEFPYLMRFGVKNISDIDVNNFKLLLKNGENFRYKDGQQLEQTISVLKPGQTKWFEYWIIPQIGFTGYLDIQKSFITGDGGIKWRIVPIRVARGDGLRGLYFSDKDFEESKLYRVDREINFNWGTGSPASSINSNEFSIRWFGSIITKFHEPMTLRVASNQSVRLWIDGNKVIDTWWDTAEKTGKTCTISDDGFHSIQIELGKRQSGSAGITLYWSSDSQEEEVIPGRYMYSESQYDNFSTDMSAVMVVSKDDEHLLSGAAVSISDMGYNATTDEKGIAVLKANDKTHRVRITMSGYYPYEVDIDFSKTPLYIVYLQKIQPGYENAPYIQAALLEKDGQNIDLSGYEETINIDMPEYSTIRIPVNWNGHGAGQIRLYHGSSYISTSDTTLHRQLGIDFKTEGNDTYLVAYGQDGTASQHFKIKMNFDKLELENLGGNLNLPTDQLNVAVPPNKNMLANEKMGFAIGPIEISKEIKDNKLEIQFGYKVFNENKFTDLKKAFQDPKIKIEGNAGTLTIDQDLKSLDEKLADYERALDLLKSLGGQRVQYSISGKFKAGVLVGGYIEAVPDNNGNWVISEGGLLIIADGSISFGQQFIIGPVPVFVKFTVGAKLTFKTGVKGSVTENNSLKWSGTTLDFELKISPEAGVGIADVASLSLRGDITIKLMSRFDPSFDWAANIKFGLAFILKLLIFEYEKNMVESEEIPLRDFGNPANRARALALQDIYNTDNYSVSSRDYIDSPSVWIGGNNPKAMQPLEDVAGIKDRKQILMENIYPEAEPEIAASKEGNVLVWLADRKDRNAVNRTGLVYSVKDSEEGWTEPKAVYDDGTADFYHDIASDGKNVFAAWQNIKEKFEESNVTVEGFAAASEIMVSRYDNVKKAFEEPVALTNDSVMDRSPSISVNGSRAFAAWIRNDANDIFGIDGKNDIMYAMFDGTKWSAPQVLAGNAGLIITLSTAYKGDSAYAIYSLDTDGDITTLEDREIYYVELNGGELKAPVRLTDNAVADSNPEIMTMNNKISALWYSESNLKYIEDLKSPKTVDMFQEPVQGLNDSYKAVSDGTNLSLLWVKEDQSGSKDVYTAIYDNDAKVLGYPVKVTENTERVKTVDGAYDTNGNLDLCFDMAQKVENEKDGSKYYTDGRNDLYVSKVVREYNASVVDKSTRWSEHDFKPGNAMNVSFDIKNNGTASINKLKIEAYYEDPQIKEGTPFQTIEQDSYIKQGDIKTITVQFTPSEYKKYNVFYKVTVANGQDIDESDNYTRFTAGYCDIEVSEIKVLGEGDDKTMLVLLKNNSGITARNISLVLTEDSLDGKRLYEKSFEKLGMGDTALATYAFNIKDLKCPDSMGKIYALIKTDSEEDITGNNWDYAAVFDPSKKIPFEVSVKNAVNKDNECITADLDLKNVYINAMEGLLTTELYDKTNGQMIEKQQQIISLGAGESKVITQQFTKDAPYNEEYFIKAYVERSEGSSVPAEIVQLSDTITAQVKIPQEDVTPPTVSGAATAQPNKNGWYNSNVTVHFEAEDSESGIDTLTPDTTITEEGLALSVTGTAVDKAGNSESAVITGINIDKTKPVITESLSEVQNYGSSINLTFDAKDQLSGIESSYVLFNGERYDNGALIQLIKAGDNKVEFIAEDKAGNTAVVSKIIKVVISGVKISGYVIPDFAERLACPSKVKSGFRVEIVGTGLYALSDDEGYFEIYNVPTGSSCTLRITKQNYLLREIKNVTPAADMQISTQSSPIYMWVGDVDIKGVQDNAINMKDVMQIATAFNTGVGHPEYREDYDFNGDNCINLIDIMIVAAHFNRKSGDYVPLK